MYMTYKVDLMVVRDFQFVSKNRRVGSSARRKRKIYQKTLNKYHDLPNKLLTFKDRRYHSGSNQSRLHGSNLLTPFRRLLQDVFSSQWNLKSLWALEKSISFRGVSSCGLKTDRSDCFHRCWHHAAGFVMSLALRPGVETKKNFTRILLWRIKYRFFKK